MQPATAELTATEQRCRELAARLLVSNFVEVLYSRNASGKDEMCEFLMELVQDKREHTRVFGWQMLFNISVHSCHFDPTEACGRTGTSIENTCYLLRTQG